MATGAETLCRVLRPDEAFTGRQGLSYAAGISAESVGARAIHLQPVTIPPGARAQAHMHAGRETAISALAGLSCMWWGDRLEHHAELHPGAYLHIPAGVPHRPYNPSSTAPRTAIIAPTDPNGQASVVPPPELDGIHP